VRRDPADLITGQLDGDWSVEKTPGSQLGADKWRLLREFGYGESRITALADDGVITYSEES
jgi:hypothetical protein